MNTYLKNFAAFSEKHGMLPNEGTVLAAVSGGADSMCLLHMLMSFSKTQGFTVAAAHFNHMIRGDEADRDEAFVRDFCSQNGIVFYAGRGDVPTFSKTHGLSLEEAARNMRYAFLYETAEKTGAKKIATAHNADDNVETVLLNFTRGSGLSGMRGIPPVRENIIRPLLKTPRTEIIKYLSENGISYVEDSTNAEDLYARNRLRHNVVPVLKELNPALLETACGMTEILSEAEDFIVFEAERFIDENYDGRSVSANALTALHPALSKRVIIILSEKNLSSKHVEAIYALALGDSPSGEVQIPGGRVFREYDRLVFGDDGEDGGFEPFTISPGSRKTIDSVGLAVSCELDNSIPIVHKSFNTFLFKSDLICGNITIRPKKQGDKITFLGRNITKTVKKLFIDAKIPKRQRNNVPIIADENGLLAVYGFGIDRKKAAESGDTVLKITFEEII